MIVSTHDDRMLPLADQVVDMAPPAPEGKDAGGPERVSLADSEMLFEQGSVGTLIYEVISGSIELFRVRPDGGEERVSVAGPGQWFGEMGPLFHLPRAASARGVGPTELLGLSVAEFRRRRTGGPTPPA